MTLLLHLLNKDFRALRLWLVTILLLVAGILLWPRLEGWGAVSDPSTSSVFLLVIYLIWLEHILMRKDAVDDPNRFLGTRPVSGGMVLLSKATFLLVAGVLPISLALAAHLALAGMHLTAADLGAVMLENSVLLVAMLSLFAFVTGMPSLSLWLRTPVLVVALSFLPWSTMTLAAAPVLPPVFYSIFALQCGLAGAAAAGLAARYARLRLLPALALCAIVSIGAGWIASVALKPSRPPASPLLPLQVLPRAGGLSASSFQSSLEIRYDCRLEGLPEGAFAEQTGWTSDVKIAGQPNPNPSWLAISAPPAWRVPIEIAQRALPGKAKSPAPSPNHHLYLRLAMVEAPGVKKGDLIRITLRGVQRFDLFRVELAQTLPFADGAVWSSHGARVEFDKVVRMPGLLKMEAESAMVYLRSDVMHGDLLRGMGDFGFFAVDLSARRLFKLDAVTQQTSHLFFYRQSRTKTLLRIPLKSDASQSNPPSDPDQILLAVFRRIKIGEAHVPFDFTEVPIKVD